MVLPLRSDALRFEDANKFYKRHMEAAAEQADVVDTIPHEMGPTRGDSAVRVGRSSA